jgi:iron complex outermembrane recepter protein
MKYFPLRSRPGRIRDTLRPAFFVAFGISLISQSHLAAQGSRPASEAVGERTVEVERLVVTGSNIKRLDMEKIVPVTVLDRTAIEVRNALVPVDLLTSIPSVVNLPENETRLGSSGARGDNANINLRNMGATATLILVNGRRMAINPMTAGLSQAVNVNQLPTRGIERVEVLRDGASSIYGSDAVGGVINYVLKREFDGAEASFRFGYPDPGGGESVQGTLTFGTPFAEGRGRLFGTIEALYRDAIFLSDRGAHSCCAERADRTIASVEAERVRRAQLSRRSRGKGRAR